MNKLQIKKRTLSFYTLSELVQFSKTLKKGYLINTINLTITTEFSLKEIEKALEGFNAHLMQTSEKVFSYSSNLLLTDIADNQ